MTQATPSAASAGPGAARLLSDDQLAHRATKGDQRAFAAIYRRYHQDLYRYCAAIVGNPEDAHDALQNTMVKVLRSLPGEKRRVQLKPWLYRIAHNESVELLRRRRPVEQIDPELAAGGAERRRDGGPSPAPAAADRRPRRASRAPARGAGDARAGRPELRADRRRLRHLAGGRPTDPLRGANRTPNERGARTRCEEVCRVLSDGDRRRSAVATSAPTGAAAPIAGASATAYPTAAATSPRSRRFRPPPRPACCTASSTGAHGASGAGLGTAGAAAAGKALTGSALVKSAATVAVVAAVGVSAADRGGLIHVLPASGDRQQREAQSSPDGSDRRTQATDQGGGETGDAASTGNATRGGTGRPRQGSAKAAVQNSQANVNERRPRPHDRRERARKRTRHPDGLCPRQRNSRQPFPSTPRASHPRVAPRPREWVEIDEGRRCIPRGRCVAPVPRPSTASFDPHPHPPHASPVRLRRKTPPEGRALKKSTGATEQPAEP